MYTRVTSNSQIPWSRPPEYWNYKHAQPHLAKEGHILDSVTEWKISLGLT